MLADGQLVIENKVSGTSLEILKEDDTCIFDEVCS